MWRNKPLDELLLDWSIRNGIFSRGRRGKEIAGKTKKDNRPIIVIDDCQTNEETCPSIMAVSVDAKDLALRFADYKEKFGGIQLNDMITIQFVDTVEIENRQHPMKLFKLTVKSEVAGNPVEHTDDDMPF